MLFLNYMFDSIINISFRDSALWPPTQNLYEPPTISKYKFMNDTNSCLFKVSRSKIYLVYEIETINKKTYCK